MRFCPFCAQENSDEGAECVHCGRRLPVVAAGNTGMARALPPAAPAVRPPPVRRPLPRPRPVAPVRELERSAPVVTPVRPQPPVPTTPSGMITATTQPSGVPEAVQRARTGTLLGIVSTDVTDLKERISAPSDEGATRVESSPFEGGTQTGEVTAVPDVEHTTPQERFDSDRGLLGKLDPDLLRTNVRPRRTTPAE
jgi:hypothetical protein